MSVAAVERRRHRRVDLPVKVVFRLIEGASVGAPFTSFAKDVGLAGVFVIVPGSANLKPGAAVSYSVEVPPERQRQFPFTRLMGKGWIVRLAEKETDAEGGILGTGVAIAFADDVTALSTVQPV